MLTCDIGKTKQTQRNLSVKWYPYKFNSLSKQNICHYVWENKTEYKTRTFSVVNCVFTRVFRHLLWVLWVVLHLKKKRKNLKAVFSVLTTEYLYKQEIVISKQTRPKKQSSMISMSPLNRSNNKTNQIQFASWW